MSGHRNKRARLHHNTSTLPTAGEFDEGESTGDDGRAGKRQRSGQRRATVYDAVAGRLTASGFISSRSHGLPSSQYRDTLSHGRVPLRPGEALFRQPRAPERFEEDDFYAAHRHLGLRVTSASAAPATASSSTATVTPTADGRGGKEGMLPSSDLLIALHAYTSDFYGAVGDEGDWRTLDETALLALGILVEEIVGDVLGDDGDLVFVEGERDGGVVCSSGEEDHDEEEEDEDDVEEDVAEEEGADVEGESVGLRNRKSRSRRMVGDGVRLDASNSDGRMLARRTAQPEREERVSKGRQGG